MSKDCYECDGEGEFEFCLDCDSNVENCSCEDSSGSYTEDCEWCNGTGDGDDDEDD